MVEQIRPGRVEQTVSYLGLLICIAALARYVPLSIFSSEPATGGDMGSHFWPLYLLVNEGVPNHTLRLWNPGNLAGEPVFVHYFPLPYFVMVVLAQVFPLGTAFNLGTVAPLLALPLCVFVCLRLQGHDFPAAPLGAACSLLFLLNESYSMWGGNALSLLAGQFAHLYGICCLLLWVGFTERSFICQRFSIAPVIWLVCMGLSHAYVVLLVPFFYLAWLICAGRDARVLVLRKLLLQTSLSTVMLAWFVIPMLDNAPWTTPFSIAWNSGRLLSEVFPAVLCPAFIVAGIALCVSWTGGIVGLRQTLQWFLPTIGALLWYFILPSLGLVDVRMFPQLQLFCCVLAAIFVSALLRKISLELMFVVTLPLVCVVTWWADYNVVKLPSWMEWNYAGWRNKPLSIPLTTLSSQLKGDFSQSRIAYENAEINAGAGSIRVFEMLPYFTGRSTLESVYLQATIVAPMVYYLQALISQTPSCPFREYTCPAMNIERALPLLRLFGVGDIILSSEAAVAQAKSSNVLRDRGAFGPWSLFSFAEDPGLVSVINDSILVTRNENWKQELFEWFTQKPETNQLLVVGQKSDVSEIVDSAEAAKQSQVNMEKCAPGARVGFNSLTLTTKCPGVPVVLRFAYHPAWRSLSGERIYLVSPGFLAVVPRAERVVLTFGPRVLWQFADGLSLIGVLLLSGWLAAGKFRYVLRK